MVRDVELVKARIYDVKGNDNVDSPLCNSFVMDDDYLIVGNHVDEIFRKRIPEGEYIDFSKLLVKDRIIAEEDH